LSTTVSLWRDAAAARGSIAREIADEKRFAGLKGPGGRFVSSTCSRVGSLDAMMCHERTRPTRGGDLFGTWVVFSVDQIRAGVTMTRTDTMNVDAVVLSLDAKLRHRMLAAVGRRR
jgi:hypothetical protein